jgi:glucan phosphoethanolaminetransferase (alkaline phosphatase superfamily)
MIKKQKYTLIIFLSLLYLCIITSIISYQKITYYYQADRDFYVSITERYIQPFYNNISLFIWCIGFIFLSLFTYIFFRNHNDPGYKKYLVDYKLLFKTAFIFVLIFYFIGIFGEIFPTFSVSNPEINLISQTEYKKNTNINDSDIYEFNKEKWIEI